MRAALALLVAVGLASAARAQVPDSTDARESTDVLATPVDSLAPPPPVAAQLSAVAPFGPAPGAPVTPVPATTASLSVAELLAGQVNRAGRAPAAFVYALSAPGRSGGLSLDGLAPGAPGLTLDGRPFDDPFTGVPRLDLLPLAAIGPMARGDGMRGRATSLAARVRDFRVSVPVTEIRYTGLQNGVRHASGTHAQTRRAPAFLGGGSDASRLTATFHAASRAADAPQAGGQLRHIDALGRLLLTRPGLAAELGVIHTDQTEGARAGLVSDTPSLDGVFDFATATPREPGATRRTLRTEGWARARLPLAAVPAEAGVSVAVQRLVYSSGVADTVRAHGTRLAAFAEQPVVAGGHRLALRVDGVYDLAPDAGVGGFAEAGSRLGAHATATDSLRLGPAGVVLGAGIHAVGGAVWPSASVRAGLGPVTAGVRLGGRAPSRLEEVGLARITRAPETPTTQTAVADAGLDLGAGDWRLGVRLFASAERNGREVAATSDTTAAVLILPSLVQGGAAATASWRETARRGLYLRLDATTRAVADAADGLRQRVDAALPRAWAGARVGVRAEGVGDGVLDLDLAAVGRGWSAFRSRLVEPVTGVLVLPQEGTPLGAGLPTRGTLGLEATATFSARASLFVRYDHVLGGRWYDGAIVTQGEPLAPHVLRFGVFWALLN